MQHLEEEGHPDAAQRLQGLSEALQENGTGDRGGGGPSLSEEGFNGRARFLEHLISTVVEHQNTELAHKVLDEHIEQIDEATVEIFLQHMAGLIQNAGGEEESAHWAAVTGAIGQILGGYPRGPRDINLEWAIGVFKTILHVFTREAAPHDWAQVQNNLGIAYQKRLRGDRAANLERVIDAYEKALQVPMCGPAASVYRC